MLLENVMLLFNFNVESTFSNLTWNQPHKHKFSQEYWHQFGFTFNGKNYSRFTCFELFPYNAMTWSFSKKNKALF